uniref:40S ribosomal protein S30 n=1 Tax=Pseudodiaptomus poplesia TaxID=213370 RepID=A0A0U2LG78_9MAXI|nr:40S ribosomal protein S30 [Pseudodiaptomus poplesia]ALS04795.1 40S ribosomal protein S30 [Pseudodiaptomus poplesia]ALS04888.1 40S ribosomal protein S30 [Pseudodiaptomus poplesia]
MQLIVRSQSTHVLDVAPDANVEVLRKQLALLEGVEPESLNLFCSGSPLEDDVSLSTLENLAVDLTIPLLGGKVHGSLARAGKVRGQTPKVEAGEKKKKKTGRAKRRIQYNRRFVNVVETFGRKKGPNSNS